MGTSLSKDSVLATIRAVIPDLSRVEALIRLWEKQRDGSDLDEQILLVASVVMLGQQVPSPVTALSVSRSLAEDPVWEAMVRLAQALGGLGPETHLSPVFFPVIQEAIQAAAKKLEQVGNLGPVIHKEQ